MAKRVGKKIQVTRRALAQRINRKLAQSGEQLKAYRGPRRLVDGDYFVVDVQRARITREHVRDLEALGRELEALDEWEELEEGGGKS